jgi:hypothetical protein
MPGVNGVRAAVLVEVKLSVEVEAIGAVGVTGVGVACGGTALVKPAPALEEAGAARSGLTLLNPAEPVGVVESVGVLELDTRPLVTGEAGVEAVGVVLTIPGEVGVVGVGALAVKAVLGRATGVVPAAEVKPGVAVGVVDAGAGVVEAMAVRGVGVVGVGVVEAIAVRGVGVV